MKNLTDYVDWIAKSMNVHLTDKQLQEIAHELIEDKLYNEMLKNLEKRIQEVK